MMHRLKAAGITKIERGAPVDIIAGIIHAIEAVIIQGGTIVIVVLILARVVIIGIAMTDMMITDLRANYDRGVGLLRIMSQVYYYKSIIYSFLGSHYFKGVYPK